MPRSGGRSWIFKTSAHCIAQTSGELGPFQKRVDELHPPGGIFVRQERSRLFHRRQQVDDVEIGAAQKRLVRAQLARRDASLAQLVTNSSVDVVATGERVRGADGTCASFRQHQYLRDDREGRKTGHHEGLAGVAARDQSLVVDLRGGLVARAQYRELGDVAVAAVLVDGANDEVLLLIRARHHHFFGTDLDPGDLQGLVRVTDRAGRDPVANGRVGRALRIKPLAALVSDLQGRLAQHQTFFGSGGVEAAPLVLPRQPLVVLLRIEAEQRELEAVLAGSRAVTAARIAALLREDGHDVAMKRRRRPPVSADHLDLRLGRNVAVTHGEGGLSVRERLETFSRSELREIRIVEADRDLRAHVEGSTVGEASDDDQTRSITRAIDPQTTRMDVETDDGVSIRRRLRQQILGGQRRGRGGQTQQSDENCPRFEGAGVMW